MSFVLSLLISD